MDPWILNAFAADRKTKMTVKCIEREKVVKRVKFIRL